jgi:ssDNA-binding Zn-finger/Zn-ribbon topoisomerase 1
LGKNIIIIYGKEKRLDDKLVSELQTFKNVFLFFCETLHAKCYINESGLVITSMNLHQFSEINNYEMGVYFNSQEDSVLFQEAYQEAMTILYRCLDKIDPVTQQRIKTLLEEPSEPISLIKSGESEYAKACPKCGNLLTIKKSNRGIHKGEFFLGCSAFPKCLYSRKINRVS